MRNQARSIVLLAVIAAGLAGGCSSTSRAGKSDPVPRGGSPPASSLPPPDVAVAGLEETALLLLLVDRQLYEPFSLGRLVSEPNPERRLELATTLARVPDARSLPILDQLATDADPRVRRAAAFAAGRLLVKEALPALDQFLLDSDDEVAAWACHGLARAGASLDRVVARLGALPRERRQARLLPDLHRFAAGQGRTTFEAIALEGLTAADASLRRRALLALVESPRPSQRPVFSRLLGDDDAVVRALAAAGLARVGTADDLEALRAATADGDLGAAIQAVDAGAAIVRAGRAAPPAAWRATLLERLDDPRPAMRAAATTAAAAWLLDPELEVALARAARVGLLGERSRALLALAGARASAAGDLAVEAAGDPDPWMRAAAARAAGSLEALELLERLAADDSALVRESVFAARTEIEARPR
ncbi:MAG TPA: HEAT repeat domain-containing protein, partial [Thermoanaerobaculia bacterium]|nr:HEAT repeat domain-containing protein [Thermoanaerobaculia bacterium]